MGSYANASNFKTNISVLNQDKYVIITTTELLDSLHCFKTWKEYLGFSVDIVTISWIDSEYSGVDLQEKIRNYLIDIYVDETPLYVLLVGSRITIPMRTCHPIPWEFPDYVLSDFYYADLTGEWNADEDGYFGEYDQDQVDFTAEAFVGRIPSDDPILVKSICRNIIFYENNVGAWKKNVLSLAAIIYYENMTAYNWTYERSDGATLMEECWEDIFKPNGFTHVSMYEKEGISPSTYDCNFSLLHENVCSEWTHGYGIVNMLGHSSADRVTRFIWDFDDGDNIPEIEEGELSYSTFLGYNDAQELTGELLPIVYSAGCSQFHTAYNMGREFLEQSAAVAYLGTTDISFYNITRVWNDERDGGAFSLDYFFFDYLINEGMKCGDALTYAKSYFADHFMFTYYDADWIYRCYSTLYGFTLYGDPALGMTSEVYDEISPTVSINAPLGHLYFFGQSAIPLPFGLTVAVGELPVCVSAFDDESGIALLQILINNELQNSTSNSSINWVWDQTGFGRRIVKIIVYDNAGNIVEEEIPVWVLNFNII